MTFDLDRIGGRRVLFDLIDEVLACGEHALHLQRDGAGTRARAKADRSPVTEADEAVEKRLREFATKRFPGATFLGEEGGSSGSDRAPVRFVVDPIDGTRAFVRGIPTWSILVGVEVDAEPAIGVAHMPAAGQLFVAVRGEGALGDGRPLHVSDVGSLDAAVISHGNLQQFTEMGVEGALVDLATRTFTQRGFGDFEGYKQLLLGRVDAVVDPAVKPWDLCAPAVLVREAGGALTSFSGEPTIYGGCGLATNGHLQAELVALLARHTKGK